MKKLFLSLLPLTVCTSSLFAEIVKLNGLYYSLGTTTATVAADQSSDKSVYSAYTSVTILATVTYNNYTYPVTTIGASAFKTVGSDDAAPFYNTNSQITSFTFGPRTAESNVSSSDRMPNRILCNWMHKVTCSLNPWRSLPIPRSSSVG